MLRLEEGAAEGASFLIALPTRHASAKIPSPGERHHHQG
jgi:hypothetical protein